MKVHIPKVKLMIFIKYKIVFGKVKNGIIIVDPDGLTTPMEITGKKHL